MRTKNRAGEITVSPRLTGILAIVSFVLSIVSTLVAGASAVFTGLQWHDARDALMLQTKPHVDFETDSDPDSPPIGIAITNAGPGPALIKSVTFYVDHTAFKTAED